MTFTELGENDHSVTSWLTVVIRWMVSESIKLRASRLAGDSDERIGNERTRVIGITQKSGPKSTSLLSSLPFRSTDWHTSNECGESEHKQQVATKFT